MSTLPTWSDVDELAQAIFPPEFFGVDASELARKPPRSSQRTKEPARVSLPGPGLLSGKDFLLPELVGYAENRDPEVRVVGRSRDPQVGQILRLLECGQNQVRSFSDLSFADQQLQRRQYLEYLKRPPKNQLLRSARVADLEVWSQGGPDAEAYLVNWWNRKEQHRYTGLRRKANRLANCGVAGRRFDCRNHPEEHKFYGSFKCECRYCRQCGADVFTALFGKYCGLWPTVKSLLPKPGFRSRVVIAKLDFTAVNLGRMPTSQEIREFNQDIRECVRRVTRELGIEANAYGLLWCDEFGGWDAKREAYNTNLHAHGVYVGPFIPQALISAIWAEIRAAKDGARIVWIERQKIDQPPSDFYEGEHRRFIRALGHALKYTGKHVNRSDGERLAELEIAFHGVRRVHTMGVFYHADLTCKCQCSLCKGTCDHAKGHEGEHFCRFHGHENRCPLCGGELMFTHERGYALITELTKEGRLDLGAARARAARDQVLRGPRGPDAETQTH